MSEPWFSDEDLRLESAKVASHIFSEINTGGKSFVNVADWIYTWVKTGHTGGL